MATIEQLLHDGLDVAQSEFHVHIAENTGQIMITELEDEIEFASRRIVD